MKYYHMNEFWTSAEERDRAIATFERERRNKQKRDARKRETAQKLVDNNEAREDTRNVSG